MPCSPNDVSINPPDGPSGLPIPGFGRPFSLKIPDISPFPEGFPEDLLELLDKLQLLIPPGALKPSLNPNFGKDIFDGIMKLLDQFMPFLMLYKFFLPILNILICIIEILCSLTNPFKLIKTIKRLFKRCIPDFLNLFPIFALIIMIISLLLLLLALIEYIIAQILKFIKALLRNINALIKAFSDADANSIAAIAKKLGALLCIFQNLFVLLSIFNIIVGIIKDILSLLFSIPPCDDGNTSDEGCCTPDVCPEIVKQEYDRSTGVLQYYPRAAMAVSGFATLMVEVRPESWQLYDNSQTQAQTFINIIDAFDVTNVLPKPVFFPTDSVYTKDTAPKQAPYVIDLRLFYNPANWGRSGTARYIKFTNCIMTLPPTDILSEFNLASTTIANGVVKLAGGAGFEDDGVTPLAPFLADGITPTVGQATLENFIHMADNITINPTAPTLLVTDGHTFTDVTYTFKPNLPVLLNKSIITAGCEPSLAVTKGYINQAFAGDVGVKTAQLRGIFDDVDPATGLGFPDLDACQACLSAALSALRSDLTVSGAANFQTTALLCLQKLKDETNGALNSLITIGFEACKSDFTVEPNIQFTSKPILVSVNLKERNGLPITSGLPSDVASELAQKIAAHLTFGQISEFSYDGTQSFIANLTSDHPGTGDLMISFDDNIFCINNIPEDIDEDPSRTLQSLPYQFVYTPVAEGVPGTAEGDTDGKPRRGVGDTGTGGV